MDMKKQGSAKLVYNGKELNPGDTSVTFNSIDDFTEFLKSLHINQSQHGKADKARTGATSKKSNP